MNEAQSVLMNIVHCEPPFTGNIVRVLTLGASRCTVTDGLLQCSLLLDHIRTCSGEVAHGCMLNGRWLSAAELALLLPIDSAISILCYRECACHSGAAVLQACISLPNVPDSWPVQAHPVTSIKIADTSVDWNGPHGQHPRAVCQVRPLALSTGCIQIAVDEPSYEATRAKMRQQDGMSHSSAAAISADLQGRGASRLQQNMFDAIQLRLDSLDIACSSPSDSTYDDDDDHDGFDDTETALPDQDLLHEVSHYNECLFDPNFVQASSLAHGHGCFSLAQKNPTVRHVLLVLRVSQVTRSMVQLQVTDGQHTLIISFPSQRVPLPLASLQGLLLVTNCNLRRCLHGNEISSRVIAEFVPDALQASRPVHLLTPKAPLLMDHFPALQVVTRSILRAQQPCSMNIELLHSSFEGMQIALHDYFSAIDWNNAIVRGRSTEQLIGLLVELCSGHSEYDVDELVDIIFGSLTRHTVPLSAAFVASEALLSLLSFPAVQATLPGICKLLALLARSISQSHHCTIELAIQEHYEEQCCQYDQNRDPLLLTQANTLQHLQLLSSPTGYRDYSSHPRFFINSLLRLSMCQLFLEHKSHLVHVIEAACRSDPSLPHPTRAAAACALSALCDTEQWHEVASGALVTMWEWNDIVPKSSVARFLQAGADSFMDDAILSPILHELAQSMALFSQVQPKAISADDWLLALASSTGCARSTHEQANPDAAECLLHTLIHVDSVPMAVEDMPWCASSVRLLLALLCKSGPEPALAAFEACLQLGAPVSLTLLLHTITICGSSPHTQSTDANAQVKKRRLAIIIASIVRLQPNPDAREQIEFLITRFGVAMPIV